MALASVAFVVLGFVVGALVLARQRARAATWQQIDRILEEKELSPEENCGLRTLIKRWSPNDPLRAVTVQETFDACVAAEMARLQKEGREKQFDEVGVLLRQVRCALGLDYVPVGKHIHSTRELYLGQEVWISRADRVYQGRFEELFQR